MKALAVSTPAEVVQRLMHSTDQSVWTATALCLVLDGRAASDLKNAAADVLASHGLDGDGFVGDLDRPRVAAQAAAPILQAATLLRGDGDLWSTQSDAALVAQGRASARGAAAFAQFALPKLDGMASAISQPGARMLDVGTGIAALAVAYAEQFPELTVVGIDVLPRVLVLAAATVASSKVADRVVLRNQDIAALDDRDTYALAWVPAAFVPAAALEVGMARVVEPDSRRLGDAGPRTIHRGPRQRRPQPLQDRRLRRDTPGRRTGETARDRRRPGVRVDTADTPWLAGDHCGPAAAIAHRSAVISAGRCNTLLFGVSHRLEVGMGSGCRMRRRR